MALKWLFFPNKIAGIAQWVGASPPGPHTCHYVQNVKNNQNVIQMVLKWLFFSHFTTSQPTTLKIVITGFLNKQMLEQNATITTKPSLTVIPNILIND